MFLTPEMALQSQKQGPAGPRPEAWLTAVRDAGEPFQTGLDPIQAPPFFAARNLALLNDEPTTQAARRLGIPKAHTIPDM